MRNRYLVEDYTKVEKGDTETEPKFKVLEEEDLWEYLQHLKEFPERKGLPEICISLIGECVLDWS